MEKTHRLLSHPDRISTYFKTQVPVLSVVTVSGLIYNIGMAAGPFFEGKLAQCLYDILKGKATFHDMLLLAISYVFVIFVVQLMRAVKRFGVRRFANNISRSMRRALYNSLVHAGQGELEKENLGSLLTKAISDVDACAEGMRKFTTEIFDTGVVMVVYLAMLLHYDWRLTILACLFVPFAYLAAGKLKANVTTANAAYKQSASSLNGLTMDRVGNAVTYRIFGREKERGEAYEKALTDYEHKSAIANLYESALGPLYDAVAMAGAVLILYFGARNVAGTGWTSWNIAAFTTFLACFTKLAVKASHAAKLFNAVQKASVSWKRIQPLMKEPKEDQLQVCSIPVKEASLSFQDVSCGWNTPDMLRHISFSASPGEIIGITGEVASGKTMLGRVLTGEVPYEGKIILGGKEFRQITEEEKLCSITYMGHDPQLLSTTIAGNVALGEPVDVEEAIKAASLEKDLADMHRTKDDLAGTGGSMLSGGQQARLALARAFAHARSILVLDDPFASVDKKTESEILKTMRRKFPDRVVLLISHRLSHFPEFDHVLYLHDGTSTFATHTQMTEREPGYRKLFEGQAASGRQTVDGQKPRDPGMVDAQKPRDPEPAEGLGNGKPGTPGDPVKAKTKTPGDPVKAKTKTPGGQVKGGGCDEK